MAEHAALRFLSATKMGIKSEGVRCKCTHGQKPPDENEKQNEKVWHRGGVSKNKKMNAGGLPSSSGGN